MLLKLFTVNFKNPTAPQKAMRRISLLVIALLLLAPAAYAAGGGGGGSSGSGGGATQCAADYFTCSDWGPCTTAGTRTRSCTLDYDCPFTSDSMPNETESCRYVSQLLNSLKCQNLSTLRERVACRLNLTEEEQEYQLQIQYLPEECRAIHDVAEKEICVKRYGALRPCWTKPYSQRAYCVRGVLGIRNLTSEVDSCSSKSAGQKLLCIKTLRDKVYQLTKARFYDLEERAEEMMKQGVNKQTVTDFLAGAELKKQEFNNATTIDEKKQVVLQMRELWKTFINDVRKQ